MTEPWFEPFDPAHRPDPHPLYHRMRAQAPVYRSPGPVTGHDCWLLTRYADIQQIHRHPDVGRDFERLPEELAATHRDSRPGGMELLSRHVLGMDPPDHTRLRRLMAPAFGPRTVSALEPRIEQIIADLLAAMADADEADLIDAFAFPLPITVIAELLGIPAEERDMFRDWVDGIVRGNDERVRQAATAFVTYLNEQIARRRAAPGEDLLSQLVQVEEQGDRLSHAELVASAFLLLIAGHETTVNLIGNGMLELLRHPAELARLRARPELIDSAVEEMLRFNGPVEQSPALFALDDVELDGVVIGQGEMIVPVLLAANRDPAVFPEPDRFDITRTPNRHLGFGYGIHFCLGAPLARLEGRIAIDTLLRRFPDLALAVDPAELAWMPGWTLRGLRRLPLRLAG